MLPGLEPIAKEELETFPSVRGCTSGKGFLSFSYQGELRALHDLKLAVAVYLLEPFAVPRPKALLGQQQFTRLLERVHLVQTYDAEQNFKSFRFSAAGKDSAVFRRLAEAIAARTGLRYDDEGELLMRFRLSQRDGWEVLLRLTPRPLSARAYRRCNLPGGLNATLAAAMVKLSAPNPSDRVLNAMCGSGTLLLERHVLPTVRLLGFDVSPKALACARENLEAGNALDEVELLEADATALPFPAGSFDVILCDLPWGDAVGSHEENAKLYPAFLREMARVGTPEVRLVLLSHELKLMDRLLREQQMWRVRETLQVFHGGHYPKVYVLGN